MLKRIRAWLLFHVQNHKVRTGEKGAFKWVFRKYTLDISTLSGNFKVRFTAAQHPFGYLLAGEDDQTHGFAQRLYMIGSLLTTDQKFVNDIDKAIKNYNSRIEKSAAVTEDATEERLALEEEKQIQEHVELPKKERRKVERDINGRFRKAVKEAAKNERPE